MFVHFPHLLPLAFPFQNSTRRDNPSIISSSNVFQGKHILQVLVTSMELYIARGGQQQPKAGQMGGNTLKRTHEQLAESRILFQFGDLEVAR